MILFYVLFFIGLSNGLKIISSKAAGLKGFYMLGVSKFIKDNYNLDDTIFYGASAGSWNSLYLSNKIPDDKLFNFMTKMDSKSFKNMYEIELAMSNYILSYYSEKDFNLQNLNTCVSIFKKCKFEKKIYNNFKSLHDTLNCCMASSHIPYITSGSLYYNYKNTPSVDGGFFENPHPNDIFPNLVISSDMWNNTSIYEYTSLIDIKKLEIQKFVNHGYEDSYRNKDTLDFLLK